MVMDPGLVRKTVKGVISTFANLGQQLAYQEALPSINIPGELYCQWFDDVYHPDVEMWRSIFSDRERRCFDALAQILRRHEELLVGRKLSDVLLTKEWSEINELAARALETMTDQLNDEK